MSSLPKTKTWRQCNALCGIVLTPSKRSKDYMQGAPLYRVYSPVGGNVVFLCYEKLNLGPIICGLSLVVLLLLKVTVAPGKQQYCVFSVRILLSLSYILPTLISFSSHTLS